MKPDPPFFKDGGTWISEGFYYGRDNMPSPFRGVMTVRHEGENILITGSGELILSDRNTIRIENHYITVKSDSPEIQWRSENPVIGILIGTYYLIDDSIVSVFEDEKKTVSGTETLVRISDTEYLVRGVLVKDGNALSKWALKYTSR